MFSLVILILLLALAIGQGYISKAFTPRGRKFLYGATILVLFFAMLFHRGEVEAAADEHSLRETNIGKVDLGGSTARFVLASFRGPLICLLWWDATELQAKHEFQELELRYQSLTKLQPHFRSPWVYQAWNLAYNVSVEFDRVEDKYFYIAQGLRWLAEGEKVNRSFVRDPRTDERKELGDPDVRWHIGFMLQDKLSVSDEVNTHRCFLHLSCIPPGQWDPVRLRQSADQFETFVKGHPQLVRQFLLLRNIPAGADRQLKNELIAFCVAHRRLPSLYPGQVDGDVLDPETAESRRFPVWPDRADLRPINPELEDNHDPHDTAMKWYIFANEPLPPPSLDLFEKPEEARYYRMPQKMMSLIFRKQPAQAKAHQAMQLGKDGWFEQSQAAWKTALEMWLTFATENRIEMRDFDAVMARAQRYYQRFPEEAMAGQRPPALYGQDPEVLGDFRAFLDIREFEERRRHANYVHWKTVAEVNATDEATQARRHMYNGNVNRANFRLAMQEYEQGLAQWKKLIVKPRPINPRSDVGFLLAVGPENGFLQALAAQPLDLFNRTPYGEDSIVNDELVEMQDQYIRVRCRALGMGTVQGAQSLWLMGTAIGRQLAGMGGPAALLGSNLSPVTMSFAESGLQFYVAPLDLYLLHGYAFKSYRFALPAPSITPGEGTAPGK